MKEDANKQFDAIKALCEIGKNANKNDAIIGYMVSIKNIADAFLFDAIDGENANPNECEHPEKSRTDTSTMGKTRWTCNICGYEYEKELR